MKALKSFCLIALLTGCASVPQADPSVARTRAELTALQSNSQLAPRAPVAIAEAEQAVRLAEAPQTDDASHLAYLAQRRVEIAQNEAMRRTAEEQLALLSQERDRMQVAHMAGQKQAEFSRLEAHRADSAHRAFFLPPSAPQSSPQPLYSPGASMTANKGTCLRGNRGGLYCTSRN